MRARESTSFSLVIAPRWAARMPAALAAAGLAMALAVGCDKEAPKLPPAPAVEPVRAPPPAPAAADGAAKTKMVANPDGLSLAERVAKRQAAENKLAGELAAAEKERLLKYDKTKLPLHKQVFAYIQKTRAQYDGVEAKYGDKGGDKEKAKADLEKLRDSLQKPIAAEAKKMATIDPKGGNSNVTTDYDVMLNALANDYPEAIAASFDGDKGPLAAQKAELDKRSKKVEEWLIELKAAKK
jgi:hypothetical protein